MSNYNLYLLDKLLHTDGLVISFDGIEIDECDPIGLHDGPYEGAQELDCWFTTIFLHFHLLGDIWLWYGIAIDL